MARGLVGSQWPEVFGDLQAVAGDLRRLDCDARYRKDVWAFVRECVITIDEVDARAPLKPFCVAVCLGCVRYFGETPTNCPECGAQLVPMAYLELIARQWQSGTPSILIVPKARRMRMTWLMVACHVWLALTRRNANIFFVSSKEEKSAELVERAKGIVARLPPDRMMPVPTYHRNSPPELRFLETGSKILGVPEGADQLRQYTATAVFADELGSWEWPRAAYAAIKPTIEGGGRLTIVSSAYPGFFRELVAGEALG
ncbi:MAG TPA: hypothetical protein VJ301_11685 [Propionibacteriaceae bacterium]|nr:hypothetical protein [Propionibacteriaceae bacterium]